MAPLEYNELLTKGNDLEAEALNGADESAEKGGCFLISTQPLMHLWRTQ